MTGYTVHTGSTEKFAAGWDEIFKKKGAKQPAGVRKKPVAGKSSSATSRARRRQRRKAK